MIRLLPISVAALALSGCVTPGEGSVAQTESTIDFKVGPCFGFCPDFELSVTPEGTGTYHGGGFVAQRGDGNREKSDHVRYLFMPRGQP